MRSIRILFVLACAAAAHAQSTKTAKIEEIFRLTKVEQMQKKMVEQLTAALPSQMAAMGVPVENQAAAAEMAAEMTKLVFGKMSWDTMRPLYLRAYDETFTEDEISGLLLFYQSPAGQAFNEKLPFLTSKIIALSQEQMKTLMPEMQKRSKELADKQKDKQQ